MGAIWSKFRWRKADITTPSKAPGDADISSGKVGETPKEYSYDAPQESEPVKTQSTDEQPSPTKADQPSLETPSQPEVQEAAVSKEEASEVKGESISTQQPEEAPPGEDASPAQEESQEESQEPEAPGSQPATPDVEGAVVKIQAGIRGYLTRKVIKQKKEEAVSNNKQGEQEAEQEESTNEAQEVKKAVEKSEAVENMSPPASASEPTPSSIPSSPSKDMEEKTPLVTVNIEPPTPETVSYEDGQQFSQTSESQSTPSSTAEAEPAPKPISTPEPEEPKTESQASEAHVVAPEPEATPEPEEPKPSETSAPGELEVDVNQERSTPSPVPNEEHAAVKIQAVYRGYRTRKQLSESPTIESAPNQEDGHPLSAENIAAEVEKQQQQQAAVNEAVSEILEPVDSGDTEAVAGEEEPRPKTPQIEVDDIPGGRETPTPETPDEAAVKIQAAFRGYKVRKEIKSREVSPAPKAESASPVPPEEATTEPSAPPMSPEKSQTLEASDGDKTLEALLDGPASEQSDHVDKSPASSRPGSAAKSEAVDQGKENTSPEESQKSHVQANGDLGSDTEAPLVQDGQESIETTGSAKSPRVLSAPKEVQENVEGETVAKEN